MPEPGMRLVERLFDAFNRRDSEVLSALCDPGMEFFPVVTAEEVGRDAPYTGPSGLRDYLSDVKEVWEELQVTPNELERRGDTLLVRGRVYVRSRERGIRDMPVAWIWGVSGDRFVRGEVFPDPEQAVARFSSGSAPAPPTLPR